MIVWLKGVKRQHAFAQGRWEKTFCGKPGGSCSATGPANLPRCIVCVRKLYKYGYGS